MPIRLTYGKLKGVFTRPALISLFLMTNALVWYSYAILILQESISGLHLTDFLLNFSVWGVHFAALIISAIMGAFLTRKIGNRTRLLTIWILAGAISSFAPFVISTTAVWGVITLGVIFGVSFAFGMPNCMGYFTSQTPVENRGRIGGVVFLLTGVLIVVLDSFGVSGTLPITVTLVAWRFIALLGVALIKPHTEIEQPTKQASYRSMLKERPFILYLVPWIMFSLLNYLTVPIEEQAIDPIVFSNLMLIQNIFIGAFALIGGIFMDKVGRKRIAIIGFVMLGLSFSFVGFMRDPVIWYFHTIMNGVSWGILCVLYVMTIWGDLSNSKASDKYYALGVSPFFISKMLQVTINSEIVAAIDVTTIFSFTALFLFLAVLPLIYAPETLSEKIMKDRELKNYIEKAKKEVAKAHEKDNGDIQKEECRDEPESKDVELTVGQEDMEKAEELAEKYY